MKSALLKLVRRDAVEHLSNANGVSPLLQRIYAARNIHSMDDLDLSMDKLVPYQSLPGIDKAMQILTKALQQQLRILIVGDYDADGTTGAVVLYRALHMFGFEQVDYIVPDRFRFGYGLSQGLVETALEEKKPDLIITVDNGISSIDGVACAEQNGVQVIITDHHLPQKTLPNASAIVNPNLADSDFPSKALSGVGVAFYVMAALRRHLSNESMLTDPLPRLDRLLDLVALGTIADLVIMDQNNRILVEQGLQRIRQGHGNLGIQALFKVAKRRSAEATTADLAFAIGPRLNAAGRLEDTAIGIACLLSDDEEEVARLALSLDEINHRRREMTAQMRQDAWAALEENEEQNANSLCLFSPTWHEGIVGLVASQLKERFYRPAIAFAQTQDDQLKGSARSISGVHIRDLLEQIASSHPGLITAFGGHAMAAGLTIPLSHFEQFKELFEKAVYENVDQHTLDYQLLSDGELKADEITYATAKELEIAAPWGQGFPEPLFDGVFEVVDTYLVAERHLKLKLQTGKSVVHGIFFNIVSADDNTSEQFDLVMNADKIRVAYHLHPDEYKGRRAPILKVKYIESA